MAASGKQLKNNQSESRDSLSEVMPQSFVEVIHPDVKSIIYDYSFDPGDVDDAGNSVWLKQPATLHNFFGISSSRKQILALAEYAGPLDQIEVYIRKAHARKEHHLQSTLMQAITFAVIGLDRTICDEKGKELDKGMAERLLELHAELFPTDQPKALEQAKRAAPLEDENAKKAREEANLAAVDQLFTAFIRNDIDALPTAIETFKEFVKNSKPKIINDNRYYLNLLHLVFAVFEVLERRGVELPNINANDNGQRFGKLANRFCFEIIGAIESDMPHRVKQMLRSGLYFLLYGDKKAVMRQLDISGDLFRGDGTGYFLAVNSYYDDMGRVFLCPRYAWERCAGVFKTYYEKLQQHSKFVIQQPQTHLVCRCLIM